MPRKLCLQAPPATLAELQAENLDMWAWCEDCSHHAVLSIQTLMARLGPAFPVPRVRMMTRCSRCGSHNIDALPRWPSLGVVAGH